MDPFTVAATVAAVIAGAIASISGFGIGSVLTPVLAIQFDVRLAIAMVSLPHLAGTFDSTVFGFPGANGNYTNGQTSSLLGMSANCPFGANANRQTDHGIQSGCE